MIYFDKIEHIIWYTSLTEALQILDYIIGLKAN